MSNIISENSFYSNDAEKQEFLNNKEALITSFHVNVFGTLGLYKLDAKKSRMLQYYAKDKKLQIQSISDENNDTSLIIKLMVEKGYLRQAVANQLTRFLVIMKRRPDPASIDEAKVREWLKDSLYTVNKPNLRLLPAIKKFADGEYTLSQLSSAMWNFLRRNKETAKYCKEFMNIAVQYRQLLGKAALDDADKVDPNPKTANAVLIDRSTPTTVAPEVPKIVDKPLAQFTKEDFEYMIKYDEPEMWDHHARTYIRLGLIKAEDYTKNMKTSEFLRSLDQQRLLKYLEMWVPNDPSKISEDFYFGDHKIVRSVNNGTLKYFGETPLFRNFYESLVAFLIKESIEIDYYSPGYQRRGAPFDKFKVGVEWFKKHANWIYDEKMATHFDNFRIIAVDNPSPNRFDNFTNGISTLREALKEITTDVNLSNGELVKIFWPNDTIMQGCYALSLAYETLSLGNSDRVSVDVLKTLGIDISTGINSREFDPLISQKTLIKKNEWLALGIQVDGYKIEGDASNVIDFLWSRWDYPNWDTTICTRSFEEYWKAVFDKPVNGLVGKQLIDLILNEWDNLSQEKKTQLQAVASLRCICTNRLESLKYFISKMSERMDWAVPRGGNYEQQFYTILSNGYNVSLDLTQKENEKYIHQICDFFMRTNPNNDLYKKFVSYALLQENISPIISSWLRTQDTDELLIKIWPVGDAWDREQLYKNFGLHEEAKPKFFEFLWNYLTKDPINSESNRQETINRLIGQPFLQWLRDNKITYLLNDPGIPAGTHTLDSIVAVSHHIARWSRNYDFSIFEIFDGPKSNERADFIVQSISPSSINLENNTIKKLALKVDPNLEVNFATWAIEKRARSYEGRARGFKIADLLSVVEDVPGYLETLRQEGSLDGFVDDVMVSIDGFKETANDGQLVDTINVFLKNIDSVFTLPEQENRLIKFVESIGKSIISARTNSRERGLKVLLDVVQNKLDSDSSDELKEALWKAIPLKMRRALTKVSEHNQLIEQSFTGGDMSDGKATIRPFTNLKKADLLKVLKLNNIIQNVEDLESEIDDSTIPAPKIKTYKTMLEFTKPTVKLDVPPLAIELIEETQEQLDRRSIEYDAYNRYKHGGHCVIFKRSFNVDLPIQREENAIWAQHLEETGKDSKVMKGVFHGTGSVAASFILRSGFAVGDAKAGRMLGDGIYFSTVLDKCSLYVGDDSYLKRGTQYGVRGYIFEMDASLGEKGRDYADGGGNNLISPEWCVFSPNRQLRIYRAYEVVLMPGREMRLLKARYPDTAVNENLTFIRTFGEYMSEATGTMPKHAITYMFKDGLLPTRDGQVVLPSQWKSTNKNVKVDHTAWGPSITIYNDVKTYRLAVMDTSEFVRSSDVEQFYRELDGIIR